MEKHKSTYITGKTFKAENLSIAFEIKEDPDLFYTMQKVNYSIYGERSNENDKWNVKVIVWDTYDFGEIRLFNGINFANVANDFGTFLQTTALLEPYDWSVEFKYEM